MVVNSVQGTELLDATLRSAWLCSGNTFSAGMEPLGHKSTTRVVWNAGTDIAMRHDSR